MMSTRRVLREAMLPRRGARAVAVSLGALALASCTGEVIGDPAVEVSQLRLTANAQGGLAADECIKLNGEQGCAIYPNPKTCDQLLVSVRGDASTIGRCSIKGAIQIIRGIAEGVPITCQLDHDRGCVQCVDVYGGAAVGNCAGGPGQPDNEAFQADSTETASAAPPTGEEAACIQKAQQGFVDRLNKLLADEGLDIKFAPDLSKLEPAGGIITGAICAGLELAGKALDAVPKVPLPMPVTVTPIDPLFQECYPLAMVQGHCYCEQLPFVGHHCHCGRMLGMLLAEACTARPPECDSVMWSRAVFPVYGAATSWFNSSFWVELQKGPGDVICEGSPLVLDLNDDGVELSSVSAGVTFNLTRAGPQRTAWVQGADDALLAMDRNGDNLIDGGDELFGDATPLDGRMAANGFEALAALDRPEQGGNGNGLVDAADLMFDQLVLWRDADHDGRSGPGELTSLKAEGISGLEIRGSAPSTIIDRHGNDLSLRARFVRADGSSGLLVDAYFVTSVR